MKSRLVLFGLILNLLAISQTYGQSAEPMTFLSALKAGNYSQALLLWPSSAEAQGQSSTAQALLAYTLYKDKMPLLGFERLTQISNLSIISPWVKTLWKNELGVNSTFWRNSGVWWSGDWASVFSSQVPLALEAWSLQGIKGDKQIKRAQWLLRNLEGTEPGNWVKWQLALAYGLNDHTSIAVDYLQSLIDSNQTTVGQDEVIMTAARMLYQYNKLDIAKKYYDQVPKGSDYWLEALEEKAWIFARLNNFELALGEMKTILNPAFETQVGPESYFLATLSNLRVCDYYSIFKILKDFRARNGARLVEIQKLADTGRNPFSGAALKKLEMGVQNWADLGSSIDKLPRFVNRDELLSRYVSLSRMVHGQSLELSSLNAQNSYFKRFSSVSLGEIKDVEKLAPSRLQTLAKTDVEEIRKNLMKLQLVESEAIHRMHVGQTYAQRVQGGSRSSKVNDEIDFPYEEKEVWLDELDHYQASAKGCPAPQQSSVAAKKEIPKKDNSKELL